MKRRVFLAAAAPALLSACGAKAVWDSDEQVRAARYVSSEPPSITLFSVIGIPRGEGGHSALLINGSQRVIFAPAGSWNHPRIPERNDVLYGINDNFKNFYIDYHARETYWVAEDSIPVSREIADLAIRRAEANGPTSRSFCAVAVGTVLRGVPGFETAPNGFSPLRLRSWFLRQPGVQSKRHMDGDPANNHDVLMRQRDGTIIGYNR